MNKKYLFILFIPFPTLILGYYLFSNLQSQVNKADKLLLNNKRAQGEVRFTRKEKSFVGTYGRKIIEYFVYYEFIDENRKRRRSRAFYEHDRYSFKKGQKLEVLVDPSDSKIHLPKFRAEVLSKKKENYSLWILAIFWVSFAPSCIFLVIKFLQNR
ncbi:MAG: hypothetical protein AB8G05_06260 [Oligoflexales bacterium]